MIVVEYCWTYGDYIECVCCSKHRLEYAIVVVVSKGACCREGLYSVVMAEKEYCLLISVLGLVVMIVHIILIIDYLIEVETIKLQQFVGSSDSISCL